ncbi:hypothetical protein O6H91_02G006300 [Diphasiastrum complanatum]|uniref:Uncharacterized protein n=1 Tax=Diphasiastrum complanatum TaxID=34168 RepID=A0ACC2ECM4_DIPCM|nr:hypothetical protein O6H91_02G006300 [Diphasiastrum complanatum]
MKDERSSSCCDLASFRPCSAIAANPSSFLLESDALVSEQNGEKGKALPIGDSKAWHVFQCDKSCVEESMPDADQSVSRGQSTHSEIGQSLQSVLRDIVYEEDEESDEELELEEEQHFWHGKRKLGWIWKISLYASISFAAWMLMSGTRIRCPSCFPSILERDPPRKIRRRRPR